MKNLARNLILSFLLLGCFQQKETIKPSDQEVATKWADLTLYITKNTPSNSPTYASRALGYIGLTMYESIVAGYDPAKSVASSLNDFGALPLPDANQQYNWIISLNSAQASIIKNLYNQTSDENKAKIDSLESVINDSFRDDMGKDVFDRSVAYGKAVAEKIFQWSLNDGGHRGYLQNFDKTLMIAHKPGGWKAPIFAQSFSRFPLHPHWGKNRTFMQANALIPNPEIPPYSTSPESVYYKEFLEVYKKNKEISQDQKEAALWWGDDPGETFTPPGHSYYLGTTVIKKYNPPLLKCAETYARIGLAVGDAFINCWKLKYLFWSERPSTFISENIDETWEPFWPDPPFPAFPSGHATQAAATAVVLIDLYGDTIEIQDNSHVGRAKDEVRNVEFNARSFKSFWQIAEETANSRFYGGIHTNFDNRAGLDQGRIIGNNICQLNWYNGNSKKNISAK